VVDSITAVDIGALPDRNIAEALQRVPGVTLQRNSSPNDLSRMGTIGNSVYVRGLSWVKTLVNGRDEFTAEAGRSLSFADVSADLMAGVDVYKSPTAKMIEGGVGGTVDLRTRKPFDQDGLTIAVSGDYTYGDMLDAARPSANALISDRWNTAIGEIGVLASVDWQEQVNRTMGVNFNEFSCWNAAGTRLGANDSGYSTCTSATNSVYAPAGWAWRQLEFTNQRLATNLVLQWRPNDKLDITINAMNSYAHYTDMEHYVYNTLTYSQVSAGKFDSSSHWLGGASTLSSIDTRGGTGHNRNSDFDIEVKYRPTSQLEISADVQFVESSSPYRNNTMYTGMNASAPTVNINVAGSDPTISWSDNSGGNLTSPSYYFWSADMDHLQDSVGHALNTRLDASYTFNGNGLFGFIKSIDAGFRTQQQQAVSRSTGYNWGALCPTGWGLSWAGGPDFRGCPTLDGKIASAYSGYTSVAGNTVTASTAAIAEINKYGQLFSYQKVFGATMPSLLLPSTSLALMDTSNIYALFSQIEPLSAQTGAGVGSWASWKPYAALGGCKGADFTCLAAYRYDIGGASSGNRTSIVNEQTWAGYAQINFGQDTFFGYDIPIDGNIGLRVVRTEDQINAGALVMPKLNQYTCTIGTTDVDGNVTADCSGFNAAVQFLGAGSLSAAIANGGATVVRPAVNSGYTNLLPSFNFRARLTDAVQARVGYSETIVRPTFANMNSSATLSYNFYDTATYRSGVFKTSPSGYGGNPNLKPMRARNYDASVEWYFNATGSLTFSLFHKDLSDYIYTSTQTVTFTHPISGQSQDFQYTTYVNGSKGKVEGFELGYTQFYDSLPGAWGGLGFQANYTKIYNSGGHNGAADVTSSVAIANSNITDLPLEGMSNDSYNLALLYAKYGIDARLAWNWRSTYLSSTSDSNAKIPVWVENYGQLDGSVFYSFLDHYKVGVQVTNITGADFRTDMGYANYHPQTNYIQTDRKFAIVLRTNW
jgi:TonB-dependent receptor